jgi:D-beta-D-heptose 7-phosphate kinase/D-beta-D-heptose 1-phosphate adenosyltransferase
MTADIAHASSPTDLLTRILAGIAGQRVLVVGDAMLDEYVTGDSTRLSPEAPVPVVTVGTSRDVLGGAANTAANITSLGGQAVLIGLAGADDVGRRLVTLARETGIEFHVVGDGRPTARKVRVLGQQQQLLRLDYESTHPIDAALESRVLDLLRAELSRASIVVISDYAKGLVTERLCREAIRAARDAGIPVIVDPRPQHAGFYAGCDYLTPNWKESLELAGRPDAPASPALVTSVGRELLGRYTSHVLLTLGPLGMRFFDRDGRTDFSEPAVAREVFDVSGAGDTVAAAFALALAVGVDHRQAVWFANRAAGVVVGKLGTSTVLPQDLLPPAADEPRLVSRDELAPLAARLRAAGRRIVTINGAFDLLHAGHLHILHEARRQGDVLIVGLNADETVRAGKGPNRPLVGERDRAQLLLALRDVDFVHIFPEPVPMPFLDAVRPDVHVNGSEYGADCIEAPTVRAGGGRVHIVDRLPGLSTTDLAARLQRASGAAAEPPARAQAPAPATAEAGSC